MQRFNANILSKSVNFFNDDLVMFKHLIKLKS